MVMTIKKYLVLRKGFNDSRYANSEDLLILSRWSKSSSTGRNFKFGLTLEDSPVRPNKLEFKLGGEGTIIDVIKKEI